MSRYLLGILIVILLVSQLAFSQFSVNVYVSGVGGYAQAKEVEVQSEIVNRLNNITGVSAYIDKKGTSFYIFVGIMDQGCYSEALHGISMSYFVNVWDAKQRDNGAVVPMSYGALDTSNIEQFCKDIVAQFNIHYIQKARNK